MPKSQPLTRELSWYESHRNEWLASYEGQFVLISNKTTAGFFSNYEEAFAAGLNAFGLDTEFLIKQVVEHEPVFVIY